MKYINCIAFFLIFSLNTSYAQNSDTLFLNIEQATKLAITNNPDLKRVLLAEELLERQIETAKTAMLPKLNGSAGFTDNFSLPQQLLPGELLGQEGQIPVSFGVRYGINAGLELSQLIYSKEYKSNINKLASFRTTHRLQSLSSKEDLIYNVVHLYIQYQITQKQKEILTANLDRVSKLVEISRAQFNNGIIKKLDIDQLTVNRTNLLTEITNADIGLEQQINLLKFYLDIPLEKHIALSEDLEKIKRFPISHELMLDQNISYQLIREQLKVSELDKEVIKSSRYPTLSAFAQYNYTGQSDKLSFSEDNYSSFAAGLWGLNASIPIFDGFNSKRRLAENTIQLEQLELQERQLVNSVKLEFNNATNRINQNEILITTQKENMLLAQELYDITKLSYQEGIAPLTELLNAETSLREAQSQYLTALLNFKLAELEYIKVSGQLAKLIQSN